MAIDFPQLSVWTASAAALAGFVYVVLVCMQCLKKKAGFSNFNSSNTTNRSGHVNNTFTLEISEADDEFASSTSVTIEPLPDIVSKSKLAPSVLRPRITSTEKTRSDSSMKLTAHHQFPRSQIVYLKELGLGWFGKVIESDAEKIVAGVPRSRVVVKMLKDDASKEEQQMFLEEVTPFQELEHAHIIRLLGLCTDMNPMLVVLEAASYGNLKQYLRSHRQHKATLIQKNRLLQFSIDAACGLACLHRHDYLHKDFAARNCLVMSDYTVKVGDYGIAEDLYQEDYFSCGNDMLPVRWMAPETLKQENGAWVPQNFSKESDIWSLGVLLWEIAMMGERPYDMLTDEAVLQGVIVEKVIRLPEPDIGMAQKDRMYEVMQFCWLEQTQRTKVDEVHGLLQQVAAKSGSAPEGDISEFEKKWEHLMPNQRHPSVDSVDEERLDRNVSVSSADSDILNDLSEPLSLDEFTVPEAEPAPPVAPPRGMKKKVSASAVSVPGIEEALEPEVATAAEKIPVYEPLVLPTPTPKPAEGGDAVSPKSPSASETEFTEFTSHDAADVTPNLSAVSASREDVFTSSDISIIEEEPAEKTPAEQNLGAKPEVLSAVPRARLEDRPVGLMTPDKPQPRDRRTSTPISKDEASSSSPSVADSSSATFMTAQTSSSVNVTNDFATASDSAVFSEQNQISQASTPEFSTFEEIPTLPVDNTESFVILETTTVPPDSFMTRELSGADQLDVTPTPSAMTPNPGPPTDTQRAVNGDFGFGEFTGSAEQADADQPSSVNKASDEILAPEVPAGSGIQSGKGSDDAELNDFPSLVSGFSNIPPSGSGSTAAGMESSEEVDQFVSFGTDLSSLSSLSVPPPVPEEKEFPSFTTDLSSLGSLDTGSAGTPQAQPQSNPFAFDQNTVSTGILDAPEVAKEAVGNPFTDFGSGSFVTFDSLSFPAVGGDINQSNNTDSAVSVNQSVQQESSSAASTDRSLELETQGDFMQSPKDSNGIQDLFGGVDISSTPSQVADRGDVGDPFGFSISASGSDLGGPAAQAPAHVEQNIDIFESSALGFQSDESPSSQPVGSLGGAFDLLSGLSPTQAAGGGVEGSSNPFSNDGGLLQELVGTTEAAEAKVGTGVESSNGSINGTPGEAEWSSPSTDTDSTTSDSGREYICEEPWPEAVSPSNSPQADSEEYALRVASEIYLSKGLKMARSFETTALEPIPEDPLPSEESAPTPSETSSVDVRFEDVFEWDDFMAEPLVGKEQTSDGSPKQSFEIPDWSLDVDNESLRSSSSVHSYRSEDARRSEGSETQSTGSADTPNARSSVSDSEVTVHGRNRTHRSYISDILSNRTKGLTFNSISATARSGPSNNQKQFYSLYEEDFDLESDSSSEGSCSPPNPGSESHSSHLSLGGAASAVHAAEPRLPLTHIPSPDTGVNGALTNTQDSQKEVVVQTDGNSSKGTDNSDALLDFSAFESADSGVTSTASDDVDKSSASGTNGASLIDF